MKTLPFTALVLALITLLQVSKIAALPTTGVTSLSSPTNRYEATLTDNLERTSHYSNPCWLTITDAGNKLARYPFDGELISGYWSPDEKYLAFNNHDGHRGWHVWIIYLNNGAVLTTRGRVPPSEYNPYLTDAAMPDIHEYAKPILQTLSPGVNDYNKQNWPISITYGWKSKDELLTFHEFVSNELSEREDAMLWITGTYKLLESKIKIVNLKGKKVKSNAPYLPAIDLVLNWTGYRKKR